MHRSYSKIKMLSIRKIDGTAPYKHMFVRAGPVLSCILGASNSGSRSFLTVLSSCTSSNNSETSNHCLLLNYGTHSKPLSWRFLIGNHPPKHMQTHKFQILIRLALENSGLNCTWLVCLIHFYPFWIFHKFLYVFLKPFDPRSRAMPQWWWCKTRVLEKLSSNWGMQLMF